MADKSFWRDVRVQFVAGAGVLLISAAGSHALGWWPTIEQAGIVAAKDVWLVLSFAAPVSVTALIALLAAFCIAVRRWEHARARVAFLEAVRAKPVVPETKSSPFEPTDIQSGVLKVLAGADGQAVHPGIFPPRLNVSVLLVDQALRGLEDAKLIRRWGGGYGGSPGVALTPQGCDYVIQAGFALKRPATR